MSPTQAVSAAVFASRLGHGRRMEGYLVFAKAVGLLVFVVAPSSSEYGASVSDIFWLGYVHVLTPFFLAAFAFSFYGLAANIAGWPFSRWPRFLGAGVGFFVWLFLSAKLMALGALATLGFILGVPAAFYGELGVMFMAAANLPRPGAPGNTGAA